MNSEERAEKYKEIYQRLKKENPCIFCVQYNDGCQLKGNECNSTSLRMYYEINYLEIEPFLKNIYIKELEEENEQLKQQIEQLQKINQEQKETLKKVRVALIQERTANIINYGKGGVEMFDNIFEVLSGVSN